MSPETEIVTSPQENETPAPDTALPIAEIVQYLTELHQSCSEDANIRIEIAAINPADSEITGIREWWVMGNEPLFSDYLDACDASNDHGMYDELSF